MPILLTNVAVLIIASFLAVPYLYTHRMEAPLFWASVLVFGVVPPVAGTFQAKPNWPITLFAATLLLACPLAYLVTDRMAARAEIFRDCFFLASFTTVAMIAGAWLSSSLRANRWALAAFAALCAALSACGAWILIALVLYLE
jgi:hypothetical protein